MQLRIGPCGVTYVERSIAGIACDICGRDRHKDGNNESFLHDGSVTEVVRERTREMVLGKVVVFGWRLPFL